MGKKGLDAIDVGIHYSRVELRGEFLGRRHDDKTHAERRRK